MGSVIQELIKDGKVSINDVKKAYKKIVDKEMLDNRIKVLEDTNKITIRWDIPSKYHNKLKMSYDGITISLGTSMKELIIAELDRELE